MKQLNFLGILRIILVITCVIVKSCNVFLLIYKGLCNSVVFIKKKNENILLYINI